MGCLLDLLPWVKDSHVRGKRTILFPLMLIIGCAYQGAGLTTVMGSTCASATTFDGFDFSKKNITRKKFYTSGL